MTATRSLGRLDALLADVPLPSGVTFDEQELRRLFSGVHVVDYRSRREPGRFEAALWLAVRGESAIPLGGQQGGRLVIGEVRDGLSFFRAELVVADEVEILLHDLPICLELPPEQLGLDAGSGRRPGVRFTGTLRVGSDLSLTATDVRVRADLPGVFEPGTELEIAGFHLSRQAVALAWERVDPDSFARQVVTFRVLFGAPVREVRVDLTLGGLGRTFALPGIKLTTPDDARLSLVFGGEGRDLSQAALCLTFPEGAGMSVTSDFSWERDGQREVHGDAARPSDDPLLYFGVRARREVTLALVDARWKQGGLPTFLRQLTGTLTPLTFTDPDSLEAVSALGSGSLAADSWDFDFKLNLDRAPLSFPFLKQDSGDAGDQQLLRLQPNLEGISLDVPSQSITVPVRITVDFGTIHLETTAKLGFNWETFAFSVQHDEGLKLYAEVPEIMQGPHLGLAWRFKGVPVKVDGVDRWHLFTLATQGYKYQLQQAPGSTFEIEYLGVSNEPVVFAITDFALGAKGLNVTATVTDRPARLNGLDTRFRFSGSQLHIVENRIQDFTLSGSGPLPPALLGDAMADISLQMAQRDGALALVAGSARLRGSNLLHCQSTRFEFQIDAIGLRFVNDGKFHLYFVVTGSAQFKLAAGDDTEGALALLPKIRIDLVECPVTGDAQVIARHVRFLIELPRPLSFSFLGAFELELRGIGFIPQADVFDGDGAMMLTGQLKFAQGAGDTPDTRVDYHKLYIGLPKPGSFLPRIHFANLPVALNFGAAFRLNGVVDFVDSNTEKGFSGEGTLQIQGLPTFAAAFAFLRVRRDPAQPWLRAWFIYLEARQLSLPIPVVQLYVREVGLGFGYRFTLVSLQAADRANDVRKLLGELKALSRTQGDLSRRDRWALDLEEPGLDPRWTVVLRALFSQTSASASPLQYNESGERALSCIFLFDAVIALRSDLTFFMSVRGWLNANYYDYVSNYKGLRERPLLSGFVLLSPRQKRLLAHVASNPNGQLGPHPPMPEFVEKALQGAQFSATLLIEPGLMHYELGWPNMLRWQQKLGPLEADLRGGFIWRLSREEFVTGTSFLARASLDIRAELNLGVVGVRVSARANVAYGARYIGLVSLRDPLGSSALYGGIGLEAHIHFSIELWIRIKIGFVKIQKTFRFSFALDFTAGLEVGLVGVSPSGAGLRGSGTLAVAVMGRSFHIGVRLGVNEGAVATALARTQHVLQQGLEATDVEAIPGVGAEPEALPAPRARALRLTKPRAPRPSFAAPGYSLFVIRDADPEGTHHFVLLPRGERVHGGGVEPEPGFLPAPPDDGVILSDDQRDFELFLPREPGERYELEQFAPGQGWIRRSAAADVSFGWRVAWDAAVERGTNHELDAAGNPTGVATELEITLRQQLRAAFIPEGGEDDTPVGDPDPLPAGEAVGDQRVHDPTDNAFEAAVRGAVEQFRGSPFFKRDLRVEYERLLDQAYRDDTTPYTSDGAVPADDAARAALRHQEQAHQFRGLVLHDVVADLRAWAFAADRSSAEITELRDRSAAFQMGLVFRVKGTPRWLDDVLEAGEREPTIRQRLGPGDLACSGPAMPVRTFNVRRADFASNPPQFLRVQPLTDARTIAIAWDLAWQTPPEGDLSPAQRTPEHHLVHYHVRRRSLGSNAPEVVYTVKGAQALHRTVGPGGESVLKALAPRFQIVDHFHEETIEDLAALPAEGRSYLYTITPYDFAGNAGRPLSLVATRFPSEPPAVPANAECTVRYRVDPATLEARPAGAPTVVTPDRMFVEWSQPAGDGPQVPVKQHVLVFRRESVLPIGSYGLDSATQRPRAKSLPTSNARPLPTDLRLPIEAGGAVEARFAEVPLAELRALGVLPAAGTAWRPESWRLFLQTVSVNGVPSALAPVQLLLRVDRSDAPQGDLPLPDTAAREERRPAELEWLPLPMRLPFLPPEDQRATVGDAHVPMLAARTPGQARWAALDDVVGPDGALAGLAYQAHPGGLRCIRFRWNMGPSRAAAPVQAYPVDLHAGYQLLELDADAHTTDTFADRAQLAEALRGIQDVQMLPAADLMLVPGDTLATSQWEAWYPSAVLRRRRDAAERAEGSEIPQGPWFSWRESVLIWPEWPGLTDGPGGFRASPLHPALALLIELLQAPPPGAPWRPVLVDLQTSPPAQPGSLADFLRVTAPGADPYGWGVLQRLGLSVALSLRDQDGELLGGEALLATLRAALAWPGVLAAGGGDSVGPPYDVRPHAHLELLFQAGHSTALIPAPAGAAGLLALAQVSLRPVIQQRAAYRAVSLAGKAGAEVELLFHLEPGQRCTVVVPAGDGTNRVELSAPDNAAGPTHVRATFVLPLTGRMQLLMRARLTDDSARAPMPDIAVPLGASLTATEQARLAPFASHIRYQPAPTPHLLALAPPASLEQARRAQLAAAFESAHGAAAATLMGLDFAPFSATDERSAYFVAAADELARSFAEGAGTVEATQWARLRRYLESLSSTDPALPEKQRLRVPASGSALAERLPEVLIWAQRFFDHGCPVELRADDGVGTVGQGPWVATAYPRSGGPAYAAPDESGRLTYDHFIADAWAHNYRFYVRPYGRYDLLWEGLRQSPRLYRDLPRTPEVTPDPAAGGLDVVLERSRPVDAPLVLRSARLDEAGTPARPAAPGPTWEVIVAQHPEQALVVRNQTQARQLGFRQVAFTVLRAFAFPDWLPALRRAAALDAGFAPDAIAPFDPEPVQAYPARPEHLDLTLPLADDDARTLDLPARLGGFQQGAQVLQWEALPFFYEHRLLLVAQTNSTVSRVNQVRQRDFQYRTPAPAVAGIAAVRRVDWHSPFARAGEPAVEVKARALTLPLRRLWEALPPEAQRRWPSEAPAPGTRKPGWLPDLDVVYQVVELASGNLTVQAELFFDHAAEPPGYGVRQLGTRLLVQVAGLTLPAGPERGGEDDRFELELSAVQVTELALSRPYADADRDAIAAPTRAKLALQGSTLSFAGVLTHADRDNLARLDPMDVRLIDSAHDAWYAHEPVSAPRAPLPAELGASVDFVAPEDTPLTWIGPIAAEDASALRALPGDPELQQAIESLIAAAAGARADAVVRVLAPRGPEQVPAALAGKVALGSAAGAYQTLAWTGPLYVEDEPAIARWVQVTALARAVAALRVQLEQVVIARDDLPPARPRQDDLPASLAAQLVLAPGRLAWTGPAPTDAQRAALAGLTGDAAFVAACAQLLATIDSVKEVALPPEEGGPRPRQADLPERLSTRLTILPTALRWQGSFTSREERADLLALAGDHPFREALARLVEDVDRLVVEVPFVAPVRPVLEVSSPLAGKLVIGRTSLRFHGLMSHAEARALQALYPLGGDRAAVARLHAAAQAKGMGSRELRVRALRGTAAPSDLEPLFPRPL